MEIKAEIKGGSCSGPAHVNNERLAHGAGGVVQLLEPVGLSSCWNYPKKLFNDSYRASARSLFFEILPLRS